MEVDDKVSKVKTGDIIFVPIKMEYHFIANQGGMRIFFAPNWDGKPA